MLKVEEGEAVVTSDLPMTRARLYVLVDAFERNVRVILQKYVTDELGEEICLGNFFENCKAKRDSDPTASDAPLVTFLEMREGYDLLNTHRNCIPAELSKEVKDLTQNIDRLVGIRNRVMHARPLAPGDSDAAVSFLTQFQTRYWHDLHHVVAQLQSDPSWEPVIDSIDDESPTLHNLPLPDYDDTGLIGRSQDVRELVGVLKRGREPVITITGEGGIGKTALAVEVAYHLIDDPDQPFETVLWCSLKYEKLTAYGVRDIAGSARDMLGAIQPAGATLESGFNGTLNELADLLEGFKVLLVLDNLETISGDEFRALYNTLPDTVSYLITSRIGVGEYERRYPLGTLTDKDSLHLFNQFVRARRISSLTRLTNPTRINVVQKLRYSPLAIKWFALAVEAGNDPLDLIRRQDELLEFCVRSVYRDLSKPAQEVLDALAILGRPLAPDELVVLLESPMDAITTGVQELIRGSMVRRESVGQTDDLVFQIVLTDTSTQFLARRVKPNELFKQKLEEREREFRRVQELRDNDMKSRSLAPVVVRQRSDADAPICTVLRQALLLAKKGSSRDDVYNKIDLARRMNPEFWEVDRVEGFIRDSFGDLAAATACYERAYENADGEDKAVVAHVFAGHLARKVRDLKRALEFAHEAHDVLDAPDTGLALGSYLTWTRQFTEGTRLIESIIPAATGKTRIIAISSLAGGWLRYAEAVGEEDRNFLEQHNLAWKGFEIATAAIDTGIADERLRSTATDCAAVAMRAAVVCVRSDIRVPSLPERLQVLNGAVVRLVRSRSWSSLTSEIQKLSSSRGAPVSARKLEQTLSGLGTADSYSSASAGMSSTLTGEVVSTVSNYGFIRHPDFPKNIFFHEQGFSPIGDFEAVEPGTLVRFTLKETDRGPKAFDVRVVK